MLRRRHSRPAKAIGPGVRYWASAAVIARQSSQAACPYYLCQKGTTPDGGWRRRMAHMLYP